MSAAKRRPENTASSCLMAHVLHSRVSTRAITSLDARTRASVREDSRLADLETRTEQELFSALQRTRDLALRAELIAIVASSAFRSLAQPAQRDLLRAVGDDPERAMETIGELAELVEHAELRTLSAALQNAVARAIAERRTHALIWRAFAALISRTGFSALPEREKHELLRYLAGHSASVVCARSSTSELPILFRLAEERDRADLINELMSPSFRAEPPHVQSELLRDYLHAPCKEIYLLESPKRGEHRVLVIGHPSDPFALSYGQRGRKHELESPDLRVRSGWAPDTSGVEPMYRTQRATVSRSEVRAFIAWIESARGKPAADVISRAPAMLRVLAASRGGVELSSSVMLRGRPFKRPEIAPADLERIAKVVELISAVDRLRA